MLKEQFLILFFTFNIRSLFCQLTLDPGESMLELKIFHEHMLQHSTPCPHTSGEIIDNRTCNSRPFRNMSFCNEHSDSHSCILLGSADACISATENHEVLWVSGKNFFYGKNESCPADRGFREISTAPDPLAVYHCTCFNRNWAIYVGELRSRENESYAIVALRFKIHNNVLYLQPAEKKVGSDSGRYTAKVSWIPLPNNPAEIRFITLENRHIFTDRLRLEDGYVLTGLKFEYMEATNPKTVKGFGINIRGVRHINSTASLNPEDFKIVKPLADAERYSFPAPELQPRTPRRMINEKTYETRDYITLERSTLEKDFGQTTVPKFASWIHDRGFKLLSGFGIDQLFRDRKVIYYGVRLVYPYVD